MPRNQTRLDAQFSAGSLLASSRSLDGKDYSNGGPATSQGASSSAKRVDERTVTITDKIGEKVSDIQEMRLSADLKTLTITVRVSGRDKPTVIVFERQ